MLLWKALITLFSRIISVVRFRAVLVLTGLLIISLLIVGGTAKRLIISTGLLERGDFDAA